MASNLSGTARIGRVSGVDVNMGTSDILERLEIGAMILGEALHDSGWGMMKGYAFMRPGDDLSLPLGGIVDATFQISDAMSSTLKYRGLWVDYEDGTPGIPGCFRYDTVTHGPIVGLAFDF